MRNSVWLTWDDHRRSKELSDYFDAEYAVFQTRSKGTLRYMVLMMRTCIFLFRKKPKLIFCQNPSVVLSFIVCVWKKMFPSCLVVDRHSNFKFETESSLKIKWKAFHWLSDYTIRHADLTIVTNSELMSIVESKGGHGIVLPDRIPNLNAGGEILKLKGKYRFLFICTFSVDEPVDDVLSVFSELDPSLYTVYVTGSYGNYGMYDFFSSCENIVFLGFVSDEDYVSYLNSIDCTIVLTSMPMTINCGSYESVSLMKPQIVADSRVIKDYFSEGCVYVNPHERESIKNGVIKAAANLDALKKEVKIFTPYLEQRWASIATAVKEEISNTVANR